MIKNLGNGTNAGGGGVTSVTGQNGVVATGTTAVTVSADETFGNNWSTAQTITRAPAANTAIDGLDLVNTTAATLGNQQYSPDIHWTGQGWATTPSASQTLDWLCYLLPLQGAANPIGELVFASQVNGGGYAVQFQINSNGAGASFIGGVTAPRYAVNGSTIPGVGIYNPATNVLGFSTSSTAAGSFDANGNFITLKAVADQSASVQTPSTGFTITIGNNTSTLILTPGGTLATGTITMPATPIDKQIVRVSTSQTVTALTVNANSGQSLATGSAPTSITASSPFSYMYVLSITTWVRIQ